MARAQVASPEPAANELAVAEQRPIAIPELIPGGADEVVSRSAPPAWDETSAPPWEQAPLPTEASGVARSEERPGEWLLWIPRALLFVPRYALMVVAAPIRGGAWVYDRFQVRDRMHNIFFNDDGTVGVYPLALFETGFGVNAGLRIVHRDVFGRGEHLKFRASYGGRFRQIYKLDFTSGERLGDRVALEAEAGFEVRPKDRFFGIGDHELTDSGALTGPIDALARDQAVDTRFRQQVVRFLLGTRLNLARTARGELSARINGALMVRDFGAAQGAGPDAADIYQPDSLIGYRDGLTNLYGEVELRYDSRRPTRYYWSEALPATGWQLAGFAGYARGLADDPSAYLRYGLDLQRNIDLFGGSRILAVRGFVEAVSAPIAEVPFVDLPALGGSTLLRGYDQDRFRDRALTLASVEYQWDLGQLLAGILFVDAGRVWSSLEQIDGDGWRVGYGFGLQLHSKKSFLMRLSLASSIDGGLFFNLGFDPVSDVRERAGRY